MVALLAVVFVVFLGETEAALGVGVAVSTPQKRISHSHIAVNPMCLMSKWNYMWDSGVLWECCGHIVE